MTEDIIAVLIVIVLDILGIFWAINETISDPFINMKPVFIILIVVGIIAIIGLIYFIKEDKKFDAEIQEDENKKKILQKKCEDFKNSLIKEYGQCSKVIRVQSYLKENGFSYIYVFEQSKIIVIKEKIYPFNKILGYSLNENDSNKTTYSITSTSSGNLAKRAIIGGTLFGAAGAIVGANTADKETITYTNNYSRPCVDIYIDSIQTPVVQLNFDTNDSLPELIGILNIIIRRNKSQNPQ